MDDGELLVGVELGDLLRGLSVVFCIECGVWQRLTPATSVPTVPPPMMAIDLAALRSFWMRTRSDLKPSSVEWGVGRIGRGCEAPVAMMAF